jgi:5'-3' exonuclease
VKKLLIVDFYALFHRARNAMLRTGQEFTTSEGVPTTGVFSFVNCLLSVIKNTSPSHVVVCYDAGGNQRKQDDSEYKANRTAKDPKFMCEAQILLNEGLYALGIESVGVRGYEADDCIFTLADQAEFGTDSFDDIVIWTCDHDILQCVTSKVSVLMFSTAKKQTLMGVKEVLESWNCTPKQIALVKALSGDASDNIKGVRGVGKKTAVKILEECGWALNKVAEHEKIKDHIKQVQENLGLVQLRTVHDLGYITFDDFAIGRGLKQDYIDWLEKYEFGQLLKRADKTSQELSMV